jgi:hypothetical protein
MFLVYTREKYSLSLFKIFIIISVSFFYILLVGIFRTGNTDLTLLSYILVAEPSYTWLSAESLLAYNPDLPMFVFPSNFLSTFSNFIPTFIFPDKGIFISSISFEYDAPLGATSIFVSLIGNFGVIGSTIFLFIMGAFSTIIFFKTTNKFYYIYYIAYSSVIPFQFFRDAFSISNKNIFFTLLLFPAIIIFVNRIIFTK